MSFGLGVGILGRYVVYLLLALGVVFNGIWLLCFTLCF